MIVDPYMSFLHFLLAINFSTMEKTQKYAIFQISTLTGTFDDDNGILAVYAYRMMWFKRFFHEWTFKINNKNIWSSPNLHRSKMIFMIKTEENYEPIRLTFIVFLRLVCISMLFWGLNNFYITLNMSLRSNEKRFIFLPHSKTEFNSPSSTNATIKIHWWYSPE